MADKTETQVKAAQPLPMGVCMADGWLRFSVALQYKDRPVVLKIMDQSTKKLLLTVNMDDYPAGGSVCAVQVSGVNPDRICYQYEGKNGAIKDDYAVKMADGMTWGDYKTPDERFIYMPYRFAFDWSGDKSPEIAFEEMVMYKLHVRGFTKHSSSGVTKKGTFLALAAKAEYLKELGINCVELMPAVDFEEMIACRPNPAGLPPTITKQMMESNRPDDLRMLASMNGQKEIETRMNYWGYGDAQYFAPKGAYGVQDVQKEFCTMIRTFHENGIEVILELLFDAKTPQSLIVDCLRHWVQNYHVDGFHLNQGVVPMDLAATDPLLSGVKLFCEGFDTGRLYGGKIPEKRRLAHVRDDFQNTIRRFLKGDEDCVPSFIWHQTNNDAFEGAVHYVTSNNGFTLADLVSYDKKRNQINGENNQDGTNYNHSWGCGVDGPTKRKKVLALRQRQMRNAMIMLLFAQGIPMIYAGDEFGNSQQGNNNAYGQDNEISWLNWRDLKKNREFYEFTKMLLALRHDHPVLHPKKAFRMTDYLSCGAPDLSLHGLSPWYVDESPASRYVGIMYCGDYAQCADGTADDSFYFAYNMHWETAEVALPKLSQGQCWEVCVDTNGRLLPVAESNKTTVSIAPRSIVIFKSRPLSGETAD